jgi:hypothetical protein
MNILFTSIFVRSKVLKLHIMDSSLYLVTSCPLGPNKFISTQFSKVACVLPLNVSEELECKQYLRLGILVSQSGNYKDYWLLVCDAPSYVDRYHRIWETCCFHVQDWRANIQTETAGAAETSHPREYQSSIYKIKMAYILRREREMKLKIV